MSTYKFFRFVPHSLLCAFLSRGWAIVDELHGTNHGHFAVLCQWAGEGEP